jgi:hypothetical protein
MLCCFYVEVLDRPPYRCQKPFQNHVIDTLTRPLTTPEEKFGKIPKDVLPLRQFLQHLLSRKAEGNGP